MSEESHIKPQEDEIYMSIPMRVLQSWYAGACYFEGLAEGAGVAISEDSTRLLKDLSSLINNKRCL